MGKYEHKNEINERKIEIKTVKIKNREKKTNKMKKKAGNGEKLVEKTRHILKCAPTAAEN